MPKSVKKKEIGVETRKESTLRRLRRIEGQTRGVSRMIEEDRYCIDILTQVKAIRAALKKVENEVLSDHADHCIHQAVTSGSKKQQSEKFHELITLLTNYT